MRLNFPHQICKKNVIQTRALLKSLIFIQNWHSKLQSNNHIQRKKNKPVIKKIYAYVKFGSQKVWNERDFQFKNGVAFFYFFSSHTRRRPSIMSPTDSAIRRVILYQTEFYRTSTKGGSNSNPSRACSSIWWVADHIFRSPNCSFSQNCKFLTCTFNTSYSNTILKTLKTWFASVEAPDLLFWHDKDTISRFILGIGQGDTQ